MSNELFSKFEADELMVIANNIDFGNRRSSFYSAYVVLRDTYDMMSLDGAHAFVARKVRWLQLLWMMEVDIQVHGCVRDKTFELYLPEGTP